MRIRHLVGAFLALACVFFAQAPAFAEPLMTSPRTLQEVHFESVADTLAVYPYDLGDPELPAATWGQISPRHSGGSYGFWCAGSQPASWPAYPAPTRGLAAFAATDTTGYYYSEIQYSYIEPSYGADEIMNPFQVSWVDASRGATASLGARDYANIAIQTMPVWTTVHVARDYTGFNPPPTAGYFRFTFYQDDRFTPSAAEGVTIDDVSTNAYKFGPVGTLAATRQASPHSTVHVSWTPSWTPTGTTPYYVIWRQDVAAPGWTQISPGRISGTNFDDTSAAVAKAYQYQVQAWDGPISTANWGKLADNPSQVDAAPTTALTGAFTGSQTATTAPYGAKLRLNGALTDIDAVSLTGMAPQVVVQTSPNNSVWTTAGPTVASAAAENGAGSYTSTVTITSSTYCRLQFGGSGGYASSASSPGLQVTLRPATTSWQGVSHTAAKYNGPMTLSGTLVSETGSLTGRAGSVVVQASPDNSTWTTMTATISENTPAAYSAVVAHILPQNYYWRLVYVGEANYDASSSGSQQVTWTQAQGLSFSGTNESTTSPAYGGSVTIGGTLTSLDTNGAPVTGRTTVVAQMIDYGLPNGVSAAATEDAPGHYTATLTGITNTTPLRLQFRLYFPGDVQYGPNAASAVLPYVTARPANIGFQNAKATPPTPIAGSSTTVSVDVAAETGAAVGSADANVTLLRSPDLSTWTTVAAGIGDSPGGHYAVTVPNITSHGYFCFKLASASANVIVPSASASSAVVEVTATPDPTTNLSGTFANGSTAPITVPYGSATKVVGTLANASGVSLFGHASDVVVQSSPHGASAWTTAGPSVASSTVESLTAPGTYEIVVTTNNVANTDYRVSFAGAGGLNPSFSPFPLSITGRQATTSWSTPALSATSIKYADSASIGATLTAEQGPVTGRASGATLQSSADGASGWASMTATVTEDSAAHYSATVTPSASRYYRFHFAGETALAATDSVKSAFLQIVPATTTWAGLPTSPVAYEYGTQVTLAGNLNAQSAVAGKAGSVVLQSSPNGSSSWTTASATVAEGTAGRYSAVFYPASTDAYFRLSFAGVAGQLLPANAGAVRFTATPTATGWAPSSTTTVAAAFDDVLTVSASLQATAPIPGESANVELQSSADGTSWTSTGTPATSPGGGTYSASTPHLRMPGTYYYRLHFSGDGLKYVASDSPAQAVTVAKQATSWTTTPSTPAVWSGIGSFEVTGTLSGASEGPIAGLTSTVVVRSTIVPMNSGSVWTTVPVTPTETSAGHYGFVVSSPTTSSAYALYYPGDLTHAAAAANPVVVSVSQPVLNFVDGSAHLSASSGVWGVQSTISAQLGLGSSAATDPLGGQVLLERSYNGGASRTQVSAAVGDAGGVFRQTTPHTYVKTWYRLYYPQTSTMHEFWTPWLLVTPTAYLSTPGTPAKVKRNKYFTVSGTASRAPAARFVTLRSYNKETKVVRGKKTSVWVLRSTVKVGVSAVATPYSTSASYKTKLKVKYKGSWRIQASVSDSYNPPRTTGWRYFTAK